MQRSRTVTSMSRGQPQAPEGPLPHPPDPRRFAPPATVSPGRHGRWTYRTGRQRVQFASTPGVRPPYCGSQVDMAAAITQYRRSYGRCRGASMGVFTTILIVWGALIAVTLILALGVLRSGSRADDQAEM